MSDIDFRQRLIEHPSWLALLPVMRPTQERIDIFHECLNFAKPIDPYKVRKLLSMTSPCVVCDAPMHPIVGRWKNNMYGLSVMFTCASDACVGNEDAVNAFKEMELLFHLIVFPEQTVTF